MKPMVEELEPRNAPSSVWQDALGVVHVRMPRKAGGVCVIREDDAGNLLVRVSSPGGPVTASFASASLVVVQGGKGQDTVLSGASVPMWLRNVEELFWSQ